MISHLFEWIKQKDDKWEVYDQSDMELVKNNDVLYAARTLHAVSPSTQSLNEVLNIMLSLSMYN